MPPDLRGLANWFGLRCALRLCPCMPTRTGYQCLICGRRRRWEDE